MTPSVDAMPILKDQRHQLSVRPNAGHPLSRQVVQPEALQLGYPKEPHLFSGLKRGFLGSREASVALTMGTRAK